jgi:RNA polymerase sigma-70 factor (ECF subfamily)
VVDAPEESPETGDAVSIDVLIERAQVGDRAAFGLLYDRFAPALLGAAARMLGGRREAADLVHDVFLEAWQHVREYDPRRGSVRTWLLLRLRSRALDLLGRAERRHTQVGREREDLEQPGASAREHAMEQMAVRQALARLEEGVRMVLELTYFDGLTAREISARAGIPEGTVRSRLARGLAALAAALSEERSSDG